MYAALLLLWDNFELIPRQRGRAMAQILATDLSSVSVSNLWAIGCCQSVKPSYYPST